MNYPLLMSVLNCVAKLNKQVEAFPQRQFIGVAIVSDTNSPNQLHYEIRTPSSSRASVKDSGDARMIHEGERLPFGFKARNNAPRIHPDLYHF